MAAPKHLIEIKKRLLKRKEELEAGISGLAHKKPYEAQLSDPADQAMASTLEDLNISLQNNERNEYAVIIRALEMVDEGTYGTCIDCNQPILEKRLLMYPNATRCLICQEVAEEKGENL